MMPRICGRTRSAIIGGLVTAATCLSSPAGAQTAPSRGVYVGGGILADVKRFSGDPSVPTLDGQAVAGAAAAGTSLADRWDIEIGIEVPAFTSHLEAHPVVLNRSTTIALQDRVQNRAIAVPALLRFRGAAHRRVQLGYLVGLSIVRLQRDFDTLAPAGTPAALVPKAHETLGYGAAPVLGLDAQIAITDHLALVPAIHVSVLNVVGQVSGVLIRPQVGLRWMF